MQIAMEDNVFQTKKNCCGLSHERNFSVKLSWNKVNQMSILWSRFSGVRLTLIWCKILNHWREFISKFVNQLEIDKWLDVIMLPFPLPIYICTKLERHIASNFYYRVQYLPFFFSILSVVTTLFFALLWNLLPFLRCLYQLKKKIRTKSHITCGRPTLK